AALGDAFDVSGWEPIVVDQIGSRGDEAAGGDEEALQVDRGQLVLGRQGDDLVSMTYRTPARCQDQTATRNAGKRFDGALDLVRVAQIERGHLHSERRRHSLDDAELGEPGDI